MTYTTPQIVILGKATIEIQSVKLNRIESNGDTPGVHAFEDGI